jgi:hypothetical protein
MKIITSARLFWAVILANLCIITYFGYPHAQRFYEQEFNTTEIEIEHKMIDVGTYTADTETETIFKIKNIGTNDLLLKSVTPDCHCTGVNWTKTKVSPDSTAIIKAQFDNSATGYFQKIIKVECNSMNSPIILTLRGKVAFPDQK